MSFKMKFLGGAGQVEGSALLIQSKNSNFLLDYGVSLGNHKGDPPVFPNHVSPKSLSGISLSHSHLDHCGAIPHLYISGHMKCYITKPTLDQVSLLINDFLKLSGNYLTYERKELEKMKSNSHFLNFDDEVKVSNSPFTIKLLDAGHIPGSSQIIINDGKHRILYTGNVNSVETRLQPAMDLNYGELDAIVCESTYAGTSHPDRKQEEKNFVNKVQEVVDNGGIAQVPAFAIGRSQEILLILTENNYKGNIYMDGMAVKAADLYSTYDKQFVKDPDSLKRALKRTTMIRDSRDRNAVSGPGVIISPAGMLGGGTAIHYLSQIYDNPKNAIFMVGFQAPGTSGYRLLNEKIIYMRGKKRKVKAEPYMFKFSSHIDQNGFEKLFKSIKGNPTVFVMHGEEHKLEYLMNYISQEIGLKSCSPELGNEYDVSSNSSI